LPKGQNCQLELDLAHFPFHIFVGQAKIDTGRVDVAMTQLFLQSI